MSAFYGYLQGVENELALKHVPHVVPRNDTLAGPVGRRGDQVSSSTDLYVKFFSQIVAEGVCSIRCPSLISGAQCDQVGGFTVMRREDLTQVLPLWIKYTEDVRADPEVRMTSIYHIVIAQLVLRYLLQC